jgi:hypothetical protein
VVQESHTRLLLSERVLDPRGLVGASPFCGEGTEAGDVFIDDLVLMAIAETCRPPPCLLKKLSKADDTYKKYGLATKVEKGGEAALDGSFWGVSVYDKGGSIGFSRERRSALASTTLLALKKGCSGHTLLRLLGMWVFASSFRRESLSILGSAFRLAQRLPKRRVVKLTGPVCDELVALTFLWPLMETDLRRAPCVRHGSAQVFAVDAEGAGGIGVCAAAVDLKSWNRLYSLAEEQGEYSILAAPVGEQGVKTMGRTIVDRRKDAAIFAANTS